MFIDERSTGTETIAGSSSSTADKLINPMHPPTMTTSHTSTTCTRTRTCHGTSINSRLVLNPPDSPPPVYRPGGGVIVNSNDGQPVHLEALRESCRNCHSTDIFLDDAQGDRVCHQCGHVAEGHVLMMTANMVCSSSSSSRYPNSTEHQQQQSSSSSQAEGSSAIETDNDRQPVPLSCDAKPLSGLGTATVSSTSTFAGGKRSRIRKIPSRIRKKRRMMGIIIAEKTAAVQQQQRQQQQHLATTPTTSSSISSCQQDDDNSVSHPQIPVPAPSREALSFNAASSIPADHSKELVDVVRNQSSTLQRQYIPERSMSALQVVQSQERETVASSSRRVTGARVSQHQPRDTNVDKGLRQPVLLAQKMQENNCRKHIFEVVVAMLLVIFWLEGCRPVEAIKTPLPDILTDTQHVISLTDWQLSSKDQVHVNLSAPGIVPGDVQTILLHNGVIQDPYLDRNFVTQRHIWMGGDPDPVDGDFIKRQYNTTWVYSTTFETPSPSNTTETSLYWKVILEGVKMGADVAVNGINIGEVIDQFLRYDMTLDEAILRHGVMQGESVLHDLTISFDPSKKVNGRFTACSGGWDWAPYAREEDAQGKQMFTLGVVKPVSIIGIRQLYVSYVVPKIYYLGDHPTTPMTKAAADFRLEVAVHVNFVSPIESRNLPDLVLRTPFGNQTARIPPFSRRQRQTIVTISQIVPKEKVELWWPNGMGGHRLYDMYVGMANTTAVEWIHKRVGFRVSALVTLNDTAINTTFLDKMGEGSGQHGMYFRVNGAVIMARGANFIPIDQLEGRQSDEAHRIIVQSAARANMNMIRIWGGGMVPPDAFYEACDEEGVLLYHDMMFVDEERHRPVKTQAEEDEIRHLVRSLSSHPSIVVWSGCNECDVIMGTPTEIYASFVMKTVASEDDSRSIWPSSPSKHGWKSGVSPLGSRPLGGNHNNLVTWDPKSFSTPLEIHGPYMRSFSRSYCGMNGNDANVPYMNTPPKLDKVDVGVQYPNQFISEFGSSVMSSFESMTGTLSPQFWSLHGGTGPDNCTHDHGNDNNCKGVNVLAERNYPCDTHILAYFGVEEDALNEVGKYAFQKQLYMCLIAQTLWMKGEIETRRSMNFYGMLIWQLNENFPTGGWGCIEYARETQDGSQILGGRWKPLMHLLESSLFRDQIVACGKGGHCYVRNDGMNAVDTTVTFEAWNMRHKRDLRNVNTFLYNSTVNAGEIKWFHLPVDFIGESQVVLIDMKAGTPGSTSHVSTESVFLETMPKNITGLGNSVSIKIMAVQGTDAGHALVSLETDRLALFVVLTTRAKGQFVENCFALRPLQKKVVEFRPFVEGESVDLNLLKSSIRVEHLGLYVSANSAESVMEVSSSVS